MNKIQLQIIGNLGFDASIKETNGKRYLKFSVAVNESYKDKEGNKVEKTEWFNCISNNTSLSPYLKKGTLILAQGVPSFKAYSDKEGNVKGSINVNIYSIVLLGGAKKEDTASAPTSQESSNVPPIEEDDLPF